MLRMRAPLTTRDKSVGEVMLLRGHLRGGYLNQVRSSVSGGRVIFQLWIQQWEALEVRCLRGAGMGSSKKHGWKTGFSLT